MEKERKGLFGRLLTFWKEKKEAERAEGIGFWREKKQEEKPFAEMGAIASLAREETKQTFWGETVEKQKEIFRTDAAEKQVFLAAEEREKEPYATERTEKHQQGFAAEWVQNQREKTEKAEEISLGKLFFWEKPEEEQAKRYIIPAAEKPKAEEKMPLQAEEEKQTAAAETKTEKQAEPTIDIEKLMRQMTKKLWEERESCGRRLR